MSVLAIEEHGDGQTPRARAGPVRVRLSGRLTAATAPQVRARLRRVIDQRHGRLVIDLQAVTGIDAVGIAVLLEAGRQLQPGGGGKLVLRANALVCRALRATKTIAAFELAPGSRM
jgi:anti-sigma B factor antagonist